MVNVDASYDQYTGRGASGSVIHDCTIRFVAASCHLFNTAHDVLMAEANIARDGLLLAQQMGHHKIV